MKKKRAIRQILMNTLAGLTVLIVTWAVTFRNNYALGVYTPLFYGLLVVLFFNLTSSVRWYFGLLNFIVSLVAANYLMVAFTDQYPQWNLTSPESMPYAHYFVLHSIMWGIVKNVIDFLYISFFKESWLKVTPLEKIVYKSEEPKNEK
jgi:hypothetical protein